MQVLTGEGKARAARMFKTKAGDFLLIMLRLYARHRIKRF